MEVWESMLRSFANAPQEMSKADLLKYTKKDLEHLCVTLGKIRRIIPMLGRAADELQDTVQQSLKELTAEDAERFDQALSRRNHG